MDGVKVANLLFRFLLELCALGVLAWWGVRTGRNPVSKATLGIGVPLVAAVAWAYFVSPNAPADNTVLRWVVELLVFGAAALGLLAIHRGGLALALILLYALNRVLMEVWDQ